jgi:hypothetical protein
MVHRQRSRNVAVRASQPELHGSTAELHGFRKSQTLSSFAVDFSQMRVVVAVALDPVIQWLPVVLLLLSRASLKKISQCPLQQLS